MEEIHMILIAGCIASFLIGFTLHFFFSKHAFSLAEQRLKEANHTLQTHLDIISAKNAELIAAELALSTQYAELLQLEQNLLRQNSILSSLKEAIFEGLLVVDSEQRIVIWNQVLLDQWGIQNEKLEQNPTWEYVTSFISLTSNSETVKKWANEILRDKNKSSSYEITMLDARILHIFSTPVYDSNNIYVGRVFEFADITEHVQKEQSLRISHEKLQEQGDILLQKNDLLLAVLEASNAGTVAADSDWRIIAFNKLFCQMWGLSEDVVYVGADGIELIMFHCVPQTIDPDTFISDIHAISDNDDMHWEGSVYMADGRTFQGTSAPIIGLDGTCLGRIWEITDVTHNLLQQQELERAYTDLIHKDNQLTLALEGSGEGFWTWDVRTDLFTLNSEFASRYCLISESQPIIQFFRAAPSGEQERYLNIFRDIREDVSIEFEFQLQSNEGLWCWLILRGIVSEADDDGVPLIVTGILMDITERKRYEKHLRELNHKMVVLSQSTRHDIVNQLNNLFAVSAALSDINSDVDTDAETKHLLELLEQGLNTTMHQIEFQKDYQELGVHGAEWQDVNACIEKVKSLLIRPPAMPDNGHLPTQGGRQVELLANNLPMLFADPLLEKAVYNLIENSLRHGEHVTQIKVTFSVQDGYNGMLTFEDNGVGISNVHKNKIFDKDFGKNTGLGLFLIREILSLTGISIYECGEPDQGARFDIMIPPGSWKWKK